MLRRNRPGGRFISAEAAHYPSEMNRKIAVAMIMAAGTRREARIQASSMVTTGKWANSLVRASALKRTNLSVDPNLVAHV